MKLMGPETNSNFPWCVFNLCQMPLRMLKEEYRTRLTTFNGRFRHCRLRWMSAILSLVMQKGGLGSSAVVGPSTGFMWDHVSASHSSTLSSWPCRVSNSSTDGYLKDGFVEHGNEALWWSVALNALKEEIMLTNTITKIAIIWYFISYCFVAFEL